MALFVKEVILGLKTGGGGVGSLRAVVFIFI